MQVTVENTGNLSRKMTVTLDEAQISGKVEQKLNELRGQVRIKGFRPGKVPATVVRQRYGKQVRGEVLAELMQETLGQALEQESLEPVAMPKLVDSTDGEGFTYVMEFDVFPELGELDLSGLKVERIQAEVTDADIDDMIETLRQQRKRWDDVERPAAEGDLVVFEMQATDGDFRYPEGEPERMGAVLGTGGLPEAMEKALEGAVVDQPIQVEVTFPEDWRVEDLAGRTVQVEMKPVRVAEAVLPEVDAEFIRGFAVESGEMEDFRREVRANLERELTAALKARLKQAVLDALLEKFSDFELPASLVDEELNQMQQAAQQQGQTLEDARPEAERRVRAALILRALAAQAQLTVDPERVNALIEMVASTYERPEEVVRYYLSNEQLMAQVRQQAMEDQITEWVAEQAGAEVVEKRFSDVMKAQG